MMIFTGVHWASMPPSRVETIDPRTLHISGEFVESNLGTAVEADGKVVVRLVAQQYSFEPQCMLVPADTPVTFRGTSSDVIHGFVIGTTNANVMLIPGYVATFTATFRSGRAPDAVPRVLRDRAHAAMWARFQVMPQPEFMAKARKEERLTCVSR